MATRCVAKAGEIVNSARYVLAIELLCGAQAVDLRNRPLLGVGTRAVYECIRSVTHFMAQDESVAPALDRVRELVASGRLRSAIPQAPTPSRANATLAAH